MNDSAKKLNSSNKILSYINEQDGGSVDLESSLTDGDLIIEDRTFSDFKVLKSRFRGAVVFIGCRFQGEILLGRSKFESSLSFLKCNFIGDIRLYDINSASSLEISESKSSGDVILDDVQTKNLKISNFSCKRIDVNTEGGRLQIDQINLRSLQVIGEIKFIALKACASIFLEDIESRRLIIAKSTFSEGASIKAVRAQFNEFYFTYCILKSGGDFLLSELSADHIKISDVELKESSLIFWSTTAHGICLIERISGVDYSIDIAGLYCGKLEIPDEHAELAVRSGSGPYLFRAGQPRTIETLKLLKNHFSIKHEYEMEDLCYFRLKDEEAKSKIVSLNFLNSLRARLFHFIFRNMFGWGVDLIRPLISAGVIILTYAAFYFFAIVLQLNSDKIRIYGNPVGGPLGSIYISILAFLGHDPPIDHRSFFVVPAFLSEFIVGFSMITLLIGILIRKLVR